MIHLASCVVCREPWLSDQVQPCEVCGHVVCPNCRELDGDTLLCRACVQVEEESEAETQ